MRRVRRLTMLALCALVLGACAPSEGPSTETPSPTANGPGTDTPTESFVEGGTLTMLIDSDPGSLDPHSGLSNVLLQMNAFAYDTLVALSPSGDIVSALATDWQEGAGTYEFALRDDVTCADGTPLTASDIAANFEYVANPENGSPLFGTVLPPDVQVSPDDAAGTLTVTSEQPFFIRSIASLPIVCRSGLDDRESLSSETAGTGPYFLASSVPGDRYTYEVREDYTWGLDGATTAEPGVPAEVVLQIVANEATAANLLLNRQANVAEVIGAADRQRLEEAGLFNVTSPVGLAQMFFNQTGGSIGEDERVRQALTMALNLEQLGGVFTGGYWQAPRNLTSPAPDVCTEDTVTGNLPEHDPAAAGALLDEAGWTMGDNGVRSKDGNELTVTFLYITDLGSGIEPTAELAAQQWSEVGVNTSLAGNASPVVQGTIFGGTGDWDVLWLPVSIPLPSALVPVYSGPAPPGGLNFSGIDNAEYQAAVAAARQHADESGCPDWAAGERALIASADVVPFVDTLVPTFGSGARFDLIGTGNVVVPTSLRLLQP